jgi:hypothetical protein
MWSSFHSIDIAAVRVYKVGAMSIGAMITGAISYENYKPSGFRQKRCFRWHRDGFGQAF